MIASPCVGICKLHRHTQVCLGCGRTIAEIAAWSTLTPEQRRDILQRLNADGGAVKPPVRPHSAS